MNSQGLRSTHFLLTYAIISGIGTLVWTAILTVLASLVGFFYWASGYSFSLTNTANLILISSVVIPILLAGIILMAISNQSWKLTIRYCLVSIAIYMVELFGVAWWLR